MSREDYTFLNAVRGMLNMKPIRCKREPHERRRYKTTRPKREDTEALSPALDTDKFAALGSDLRIMPRRSDYELFRSPKVRIVRRVG